MPVRLLKSQVPGDFAAVVEAHRQALLAHRATVGEPAPVADPLVERCIRRVAEEGGPDDFVADYEIVDDTPSPAEQLRHRKGSLMTEVARAERARLDAISPPGKARLLLLRRADIAAADGKRAAQLTARRGAILAKPDGERTKDDTDFLAMSQDGAAVLAAGRPAGDAAFLAEDERRKALTATVDRHAATQLAEIEDLTAETIDGWQMKPFPEE